MLGPHVVGVRIVVRRVLPAETGPSGGPAMTDLLGVCEEWTDHDLAVRTETGELVRVPRALVVSGKPVPTRSSTLLRTPAATIHRAGLAMWPRLHSEPLGDWLLRADGSEAARRANSVLALGDPGVDLAEAVTRVRDWYAGRGAPPLACVADDSDAHEAFLAAGWGEHRPGEDRTLVQVASVARTVRTLRRLAPDATSTGQDGYAEDGPRVAVVVPGGRGHAALDGDWLGLHGIETDPERRRQGIGAGVVRLLVEWGAERGARSAYLQVHETNAPALALYARTGFTTHHAYRYLAAPA